MHAHVIEDNGNISIGLDCAVFYVPANRA